MISTPHYSHELRNTYSELELKSAHKELMTCYVRILNQVDHSPWRITHASVSSEEPTVFPTWFEKLPQWFRKPVSKLLQPFNPAVNRPDMSGFRPLIRLFVESHIRKKLKELSESYVILRATLPTEAKDLREWAKECGDVCDKMSVTLTTWASMMGALKLLLPPIVALLTAWLGVKTVWEVFGRLNPLVYLLAYGTCFFPAIWLLLRMSVSFGYKHAMLIGIMGDGSCSLNSVGSEFNAYLLEDRLFNLLQRKKSKEKPWDAYFFTIGCLIFGSPSAVLPTDGEWYLLFCGGVFWLAGIWTLLMRKERVWR